MKILSKAVKKVAIGYTTHNGADCRVVYCDSRQQAWEACKFANQHAGGNKVRASIAKLYLKGVKK